MNNPRDIDIPKIDLLQDLRTTLEDTIVIIRKMEINLGKEKTNLLISLVEDALFFLERRETKSFPVYLTHSLREMIDKFYNLNIDTYEEEEFEVIERRKLPINSEKKLNFPNIPNDNKIRGNTKNVICKNLRSKKGLKKFLQ